MASTNDKRRPTRPTRGAGKGHKCFLWRSYGYFKAILKKNIKSGRKQKNDRKAYHKTTVISLIPPDQKLEYINNFTEELSRQATIDLEITRRYGHSSIQHPKEYGKINKNSRRTH